MSFRESLNKSFNNVRYFFPVVLIFSHLKYNLVAVFYWVFFFAVVTDNFGQKFGIPYLFLSPEYQGNVGFSSFVLIGFSFGGLTMAFNSYSYLRIGPRFPFLATVHKPFVKFCMNNCIIPIAFIVVYLWHMLIFQVKEEYASRWETVGYVIAFMLGFMVFVGIALAFLFPANKNFFDLLTRHREQNAHRPMWSRLSHGKTLRFAPDAYNPLYWYFGRKFRVQLCRSTKHYSATLLQNVFLQNRISTTIFEVATIFTFIVLGLMGNYKWLDVPAAMSIVLLLTIILMIFSALLSWIKGWTYILIILVLVMMDVFSIKWNMFQFENEAYGLSYEQKYRVPYNNAAIVQACSDDETTKSDSLAYIRLLNNWKKQTGESKPLMIIVNTSGGGSRSASWSFEVLRLCDSLTNERFMKNTSLIVGASGGMVGAAFYRALKLEKQNGKDVDLNDPRYFRDISEDLLNKLSFAASTNDIFFRYQTRTASGSNYNYDRGMAFEGDLNENTENLMNQKLSYYKSAEAAGKIPVMIFTPTIINDGRRLLIASQGLNFLASDNHTMKGLSMSYENVDIHALLKGNSVDDLRFTSVLRMNATFPFVLPMVTLPTSPSIQVMDAGTRDNFGVKTTAQWLFALRHWIKENTSGVMIVQVRDTKKMLTGQEIREVTFLDKFTLPFLNIYGNFPRTQDFDQEEMLKMMGADPGFPISFTTINLREFAQNRISLSWHLTTREKVRIREAIHSRGNRNAINGVVKALNKGKQKSVSSR